MIRSSTFILCLLGSLLPTLALAQLYTDYLGEGHLDGIRVSSSNSMSASHTVDGFLGSEQLTYGDASRFLAQSTFGGTWREIEEVSLKGYKSWVEEQIRMPPSYLTPIFAEVQEWGNREVEEDEFQGRDGFRIAWFNGAIDAPDQLRHRVAFALSEIFVISDNSDALEDSGYGLTDYYDLMIEHGLGNYRDLLREVSLHPCMGFFLSHYGNPKADPAHNIQPDENYAREVLQLFSIGLFELNLDGSVRIDADGFPIPTYDNEDIDEFAKIFTGLSGGRFGDDPYGEFEEEEEIPEFAADFEEVRHDIPMRMFEEWHEPGPKYLLNGYVVPAGQNGMQDIEDAIDNIFLHPNVGPFMARRLIQRLVTSNPTPAYIARVAAVFNDNGQGERGDLGAVVKAILLDDEARRCSDRETNPYRAMLREPIIRYMHFARAMRVEPYEDTPFLLNLNYRFDQVTGQMPLSANSVFNFFLPDYQPIGLISSLGLYAPEFEIHNASTAVGFANEVDGWAFHQEVVGYIFPETPEDEGFAELTGEYPLDYLFSIAEDEEALLDYLDLLFTHGQMADATGTIILDALNQLEEPEDRISMALYLVMISPDYAILN